MKKLMTTLLLAATTGLAPAQALLFLRTGEQIPAVITEIGIQEIKYRPVNDPGGPVVSVLKAEVAMIQHENGTRQTFDDPSPGTASVGPKMKPAAEDRNYRGNVCAVLAVPVGPFGSETDEEGGAAKLGYGVAHAGDIHITSQMSYFTYAVDYTYQPYRVTLSGFQAISQEFKGNYGMFSVRGGLKFKAQPSDSRFFGMFTAGICVFSVSGDFASYTFNEGNGAYTNIRTEGSSTFLWTAGMGVELVRRVHCAVQYLNCKPGITGSVTYVDPYGMGYTQQLAGEQKVGVVQVLVGVGF